MNHPETENANKSSGKIHGSEHILIQVIITFHTCFQPKIFWLVVVNMYIMCMNHAQLI